jgi:hypothetical protein
VKRPVWLISMDSDQFHAPPTTTAALKAYFRRYGSSSKTTDIELVHFQAADDIAGWLRKWHLEELPRAKQALQAGLKPLVGFSFYTWNAAEFLELVRDLKSSLPDLLTVAGGPHVQQAEDYLGEDPIDVVVLGEGEVTFQQLLDAPDAAAWAAIEGLAYCVEGAIHYTDERERCRDLERFPSPLDVLELRNPDGSARYESISYETSRGCPFRCAFCEWGTGAIGGKMYQWPIERLRQDWWRIAEAGIKDLWLADSNFGALKQDYDKARLIVEISEATGLPVSFATSWSKKHSRQVQEIALLLHRHGLLPHYQLALQTLTPEALRLSNRQNMSSNQYEPIAKRMSEQGVPIAAELIWGLPGDNLASFEVNLDKLLATFPNINIFGYTLLPGTEFYERRDEYRIEAIPVAGYGKAKGEYVVGCHTFSRDEGEEGYFLITAHLLLIHGHVLPLTARFLALAQETGVSALFRTILRALLREFGPMIEGLDPQDRMAVYEQRAALYLAAMAARERCYEVIAQSIALWLRGRGQQAWFTDRALQLLKLDALLCPRTGAEQVATAELDLAADHTLSALASMELPADGCFDAVSRQWSARHPGGVGEILFDPDGGSWLKGELIAEEEAGDVQVVALP